MTGVGDASRGAEAAPGNEEKASYIPHMARGAIINLFGTGFRMAFLYGYTMFLARVLTPGDLGTYFLLFTVINILGLAATGGLDMGVVRYVSLFAGERKPDHVRKAVRLGLTVGATIGALVGLILFASAPALTGVLFEGSETALTGLRIFSLAVPLWVVAKIFNAATQGLHRMEFQVYSRDIGEQLTKVTLSLIAVFGGFGLLGIVWANVGSLAVAALMSMMFALLIMPKKTAAFARVDGFGREMILYSLPLAFSNIMGIVLLWTDMLLVGYLGTVTDVGYYGAALRIAAFITAVIAAFGTVFAPVITDMYNKHKLSELNILYRAVTRWIFTCTWPAFLVIALFPDTIMDFFGGEYAVGSGALVLLATGQVINAASGSAGLMVLMSGRSHMELINIAAALVIDVALCFLLIPEHGLIGAAIANMAAAITMNLLRAVEVWVFMRMHAYDFGFLKPIVAGAAGMGAVLLAGRFIDGAGILGFATLATLLVFVYLSVLLVAGLDEQDRKILMMLKERLGRTVNT